jgi:hypothetical protein
MNTITAVPEENEEILAVISAVVAAMETVPGHRLVVQSFRRVPQSSPVWNSTGRIERISKSINS